MAAHRRGPFACALALLAPLATLLGQDSTTRRDSAGALPAPTRRIASLPVIGSAPETGLQYGATLFRLTRPANDTLTRPTMMTLYGIYTAKQQLRTSFEVDRWSVANAWHINGRVEFQRFPMPFYGIGADAPATAEEWYAPRSIAASALVQRRVVPGGYVGASYFFSNTRVVAYESGGVLAQRTLPGSAGGRVGLVEGQAVWDTRDSHLAARRGSYAKLTAGMARAATGSTFAFERVTADARRFVSVGRTVLAAQVLVEGATGGAPIDQLAQFGDANSMRGYERGRYRDRWMVAGQAEVRQPLMPGGRLGAVLFGGAGTVAPRIESLGSARWQPTVGGGLRWRLFARERTAIRVDYGVGRRSGGLYVALNEAF